MIKVVYEYQIELIHQEELFNKFKLSASHEFSSEVSNVGIKMFKRQDDTYLYVILDIYYNSLEEYYVRRDFELSNPKWMEIWFNDSNKHKELSVTIYDVV